METSLNDNILTLKITLENGRRSHSGKSQLVFTSKGFVEVEGTELKVSVNVIKKITV